MRLGALALALLLAACAPPRRVEVTEPTAGGSLVALARGDAGKACTDELKTRAIEEARYYCTARGRKASLGAKGPQQDGDTCAFRVEFWCAAE